METLLAHYIVAKQTEAEAKSNRLEAETALMASLTFSKLEGAERFASGSVEFTVTHRLTRKLDEDAWRAAGLTPNLDFVELAPKINLTRLRAVEQVDPEIVAALVTVKPGKSSIKISSI